jgi:hypothetical protein
MSETLKSLLVTKIVFTSVIFNNSICPSNKTKQIKWLTLFKKITVVCSENHTKTHTYKIASGC